MYHIRFEYCYSIGFNDCYYSVSGIIASLCHRFSDKGIHSKNIPKDTLDELFSGINKEEKHVITHCLLVETPYINGKLIRRDRIKHSFIKSYDYSSLPRGKYLVIRRPCNGRIIYEFDSPRPFENKKLQIVNNLCKNTCGYNILPDYIMYDGVKVKPTTTIINDTTKDDRRGRYFIIEK